MLLIQTQRQSRLVLENNHCSFLELHPDRCKQWLGCWQHSIELCIKASNQPFGLPHNACTAGTCVSRVCNQPSEIKSEIKSNAKVGMTEVGAGCLADRVLMGGSCLVVLT